MGIRSRRAFSNQAADVRDNRVALVSPLDDAVLHVDDEERGVRPVLECGHGLPLLTRLFASTVAESRGYQVALGCSG
jgi:hypothetical protein